MFKCLIIDDDYLSGLDVKIKAEELGYEIDKIVTDPKELRSYKSFEGIDVIICDIKLGDNLYAHDVLGKFNDLPPIILFSSYKDEQLFDKCRFLNPYIYLIKPVEKITLNSAIDGALKFRGKQAAQDIKITEGKLFLRSRGKLISVDPEKVIYIFAEGNHSYVITKKQKIVIRSSIKSVLETFNYDDLIQIRRGYLVNTNHIKDIHIKSDTILLDGDINLAIGRKFKKRLMEKLGR